MGSCQLLVRSDWPDGLFYQQVPKEAMRAKAASPTPRPQEDPYKHSHHGKTKREFLVEEHRKDFDDYMLNQVKKNKKSVKHIKKTVEQLRTQMDELKDQNKKQRSEYQQLTYQVKMLRKQVSQPKVDLTARRSPKITASNNCLHKTRKQFVVSKESSFSSKSSAVAAPRGKTTSCLKGVVRVGKQEGSSRAVLKKKIEDLKEKAHIIKQNAQQIQEEIHRKIERRLEHSPKKQEEEHHSSNDTKAYEQLMELLKTNKRIQEPIIIPPSQPIQSKQDISLNIQQGREPPVYSDKSLLSTNRDPTPLKNSAAISYIAEHKNLQSQTNLLDSDKQIFVSPPRTLKMSRCVNVQVVAEQPHNEFEGLLRECRGSGSDLSFESPNSQQQLKELEFEFDQLVRQELLSNQPTQKQALGRAIRSLLQRIAHLKHELQNSR